MDGGTRSGEFGERARVDRGSGDAWARAVLASAGRRLRDRTGRCGPAHRACPSVPVVGAFVGRVAPALGRASPRDRTSRRRVAERKESVDGACWRPATCRGAEVVCAGDGRPAAWRHGRKCAPVAALPPCGAGDCCKIGTESSQLACVWRVKTFGSRVLVVRFASGHAARSPISTVVDPAIAAVRRLGGLAGRRVRTGRRGRSVRSARGLRRCRLSIGATTYKRPASQNWPPFCLKFLASPSPMTAAARVRTGG